MIVNPIPTRSRAPAVLAGAIVVLFATGIAGCDKAREEPVGASATVAAPSGPAASDGSNAPAAAATVASNGSTAPVANGDPTAGITAGNSGPATGGTVSVISNPTTNATPPAATTPATPLDPTVLPPAIGASRAAGAGAIGPSASAPADDQPRSVAPGSKN
jgi:hypothetical protein